MDIKELYLSGLSSIKIAEMTGLKIYQVLYKLKKLGITLRTNKVNSKKYKYNESYFDSIDTEEQAYWLGFIFADGYVSSVNSKILGITLCYLDKEHLEKFSKAIESDRPLKTYNDKNSKSKPYTKLIICSDHLYDQVISLGVVEHKSLILQPPKLKEILIPHFIRGYFDGDGCWAKDKKTKIGFNFKLCGTAEILDWVASQLDLKKYKLYKRKKDNKNNYYLSISGERVRNIMKKLYENSTIYLERKYKRYLQSLQSEKTACKLC